MLTNNLALRGMGTPTKSPRFFFLGQPEPGGSCIRRPSCMRRLVFGGLVATLAIASSSMSRDVPPGTSAAWGHGQARPDACGRCSARCALGVTTRPALRLRGAAGDVRHVVTGVWDVVEPGCEGGVHREREVGLKIAKEDIWEFAGSALLGLRGGEGESYSGGAWDEREYGGTPELAPTHSSISTGEVAES
jgi:hypothetical protein